MANPTGIDAWVWVDGYELTAYLQSLQCYLEGTFERSETLGDQYAENLSCSLRSFGVDVSGFYDDATGASNDALTTNQTAQRVIVWGYESQSVGKKYEGATGVVETKYTRQVALGKNHKAGASFSGSGSFEEGVILLAPGAANGASATGTSVDNGASSANGAVGHFQCSQTNGNFVNIVQHSTDNVTFTDLITATTVTSGNRAGERKTVAGTINRYTRGKYTNSGTTARAFTGVTRL